MGTGDKVNNNIMLYITLNILIATSLTYFMSPDETIFDVEGMPKFQTLMATYFGLSIVALVLCSLIINNCPDYLNSELQGSNFNRNIAGSILATSLLIPLLSFPQIISSVSTKSAGTLLVVLITVIVLQALVITVGYAVYFVYRLLNFYTRNHNIIWNPQILVISNEMMKTK